VSHAATIVDPEATEVRDLAVAWMNRGHALLQQDNPEDLARAASAYEKAIGLLQKLPHGENHSRQNSLAAALMNRGQILHRLHGVARAADALASFDDAAALLYSMLGGNERAPRQARGLERVETARDSSHSPWPRRNLAGTLVNRACLLLDLSRFAEARAAASEALGYVSPFEKGDVIDADLALKSRRALCDALGQLLVAPDADQIAVAAEVGDQVDEALSLVRFWARRGVHAFRPVAVRLFRLGARLHTLHQPHFLAEFLLEQSDSWPDPEFRAIALESLDAALRARPAQPWLVIGDPASERQLRTWRELDAVRGQLGITTVSGTQPSLHPSFRGNEYSVA
jgi:hypothetical protein